MTENNLSVWHITCATYQFTWAIYSPSVIANALHPYMQPCHLIIIFARSNKFDLNESPSHYEFLLSNRLQLNVYSNIKKEKKKRTARKKKQVMKQKADKRMQTCANDLKFSEIKFFKVIYFMAHFNGFFRSIRVCVIIAIRIGFRFHYLPHTRASGSKIVKVLLLVMPIEYDHVIAG